MGAVVKRLRSAVSAIVLFLAVGSYAGQYQLKPSTTTPPFKNPDGGQIQYTNATLPYVGSSSAWGQSHQNDLNFVDCRGTITTVWVWVPDKIPGSQTDDPLDTPPEEVIVHERCTASYSGWYFLSGLGDGDCDNGLGFDPVETFEPFYMWGEELVLLGYSSAGSPKEPATRSEPVVLNSSSNAPPLVPHLSPTACAPRASTTAFRSSARR
jgi:hypothetical protein